jgi:enoyl-CoA hydratase/carnithine racemase
LPTVAAVNGHWFGAGALLGLAHDRRVVRTDRGWFCMPEAAMGVGIARPLLEVLRTGLPLPTFRDVCVTSVRITGADAVARGFAEDAADASANGQAVLERAVAWAAEHTSDARAALVDIKSAMYAETLAHLRGEAPGSRDMPAGRPAAGA